MWLTLPAGLIASAFVAGIAWRLRALTASGAVAATVVGGLVLAGGGLAWGAMLLLFFTTSSALSFLGEPEGDIAEKAARRDALQVVANGGLPAVFALLSLVHADRHWMVGFGGAVACATADTWATEIGGRSRRPPRRITDLRRVSPGTSGGVTVRGLVASAAGASLIALSSVAAGAKPGEMLAMAAGGLGGSIADSLLGATAQEARFCPLCHRETEQHRHSRCGTETVQIRGISRLNNDAVNALAGAVGSGISLVLAALA